ncbi:hypothetical protein AGOR_G00201040 [Albula goreensis]|uniref:BED-type domain-containing protein n=1 Tax=Albula goreensis TaxID=1534307 RepID=A0A8T3CT43_9TELE|nr:hypothetical protein AGOR_G00201040 [Albula goreensis]
MSNCVAFQTKLASIVEILVEAAVSVIDNLVDEDSTLTLRLKVAQNEMESEVLRKKIQTQNELISTRFASIMGILGKEAMEKIIRLVDEIKPQLMECEIETVKKTTKIENPATPEIPATPENDINMLVVEGCEDEHSSDGNMEEKGEPFIVVNEEDDTLDPVVLKGKDMTEGKGGRSWVWGHFTLLSPNKVQCGLCNNLLSYYKNTSGMLRHIRTRHPLVRQYDAPSIVVAATQTDPDVFMGQAEVDVDPVHMDMPEGKGGRSWVWGHFTLLSPNKVQCGLCNNLLSYCKNTSTMVRHIRTRHPAVNHCTPSFTAPPTQTEPASFMGQAELEVELETNTTIAEVEREEIPECRGGRSWVWNHFNLLNPIKVQCLLCQNLLSYNKNTSAMLRHIRKRHPTVIFSGTATEAEQASILRQAELEVELDVCESRGGRSWVWDHFTLLAPNKVQCSFCNNLLSYSKNTSGMLRHLRSRHPSVHQCANAVYVGASTQTKPVYQPRDLSIISTNEGGET